MTNPADFLKLKSQVAERNAKIQSLQGQREAQLEQLKGILSKHNCKTVSELEVKAAAAEEAAAKVMADASAYLETSGARLKEVTAALTGSKPELAS